MCRQSLPLIFLLVINTFAASVPRASECDVNRRQSQFYIPFYNPTANGHTSPARGWNTFGLQANPNTWHKAGFDFNDYHFAQQCDLIVTQPGYDYYCSIDSGWSLNGGDPLGLIQPDPHVFSWFGFKGLADHLHGKGLKLGVYLLPGAFASDQGITIEGTNIKLGDVLNSTAPGFNLRQTFQWDKDGVQQWHDSVIMNLASFGVDMIKLDFITPGSPGAGEVLPDDTSQSVVKYHNAIAKYAPGMRLDISWKLSRDEPYWTLWKNNADSLRLDQDINNANSDTFTSWVTVQRAIENYRIFINQQTQDPSRQGQGIMIRPDMDNTYIGNEQSVSGLTDVQRYSVAIHWIGAGANLITGSDLTTLDNLGKELLYNEEAIFVADFTSQWPMQPRNPDTSSIPGSGTAQQLQAWISGPNEEGTAVVVLSNLGPDLGKGGFGTSLPGTQLVSISLANLGIGGSSWSVRKVWGGGGQGGPDHSDLGVTTDKMASNLGEGESAMYKLQRV